MDTPIQVVTVRPGGPAGPEGPEGPEGPTGPAGERGEEGPIGSEVEGHISSGSPVSTQKPVYVAGTDGTDVRPLRTNTEGKLEVAGLSEGIFKIEGADGNFAKVNSEGKLEVTGSEGGEGVSGEVEGKAANDSTVKGNPVLTGGYDGTDARTFKTDTEGHQEVKVSGEPTVAVSNELTAKLNKTASNKEVSVQNEPTVKVSGEPAVTLTSTKVEGEAATGAAVKGNPVLIAGSDGTDARSLKTNAEGKLEVTGSSVSEVTTVGKAANGAAVAGNPVLMAGSDGTDARTLKLNSEGKLEVSGITASSKVEGEAASGSAVSGNPVLIGGTDGTDARTLKVNSEGKLETTSSGGGGGEVEGKASSGSVVSGKPVLMGGSDGTDARSLKTNTEGKLETLTGSATSTERLGSVRKFTVKTSSEEVLKEESTRKGLSIQNIGTEGCFLGIGEAAVLEDDLELEAGASWDGTFSGTLWRGTVFVIAKSTNAKLVVCDVK